MKHFVSKLTDADGEQQETPQWIDTAVDCGYLAGEEAENLNCGLAEVGRMPGSMIDKAASCCGEPSSSSPFTLHESAADYFTTAGDGEQLAVSSD